MPTFEPKALRQVFSQFPTGVTVITTRNAEGAPIGMTASSFNSVSVDPALILWSIDKGAYSLEAFKDCDYFAVNILSDQQIALSNRFAGRGEDKFSGFEYTNGLGDSPLLPEALAQLQCKNWSIYEGGDHLIMVGEVIDYKITENERPLVFSQGSYAQASPHYDSLNNSLDANQMETIGQREFLDDHLLYLLRAAYNQLSEVFYQRLNTATGVSPDMWRIYACLADGQPLSLDVLEGFVMQPRDALLDTLASIGSNIHLDNETVQLTDKGMQIAQKLLMIEKEYKQEVSNRVDDNSYAEMKRTLRKLF
ncbi:flavin reductase family protein [uncultured Psychrobacter sp.]|uniref:flavin reductase family protein n=1 Tax=uncultured Psychrobacter sp. TaxID=259303 RepID=UPI0034583844